MLSRPLLNGQIYRDVGDGRKSKYGGYQHYWHYAGWEVVTAFCVLGTHLPQP